MIDQTMTMRCGSCGVEITPDEYENCERCWVHDFAGDCCYRLQCELCAEEEGGVEHERDPICDVCIAGAPGMRVFWHAKAVIDESAERRRSDESGGVVHFSDMTAVRRIAIETARQIINAQADDAKDWLGWVIEAVTADGEHLMEVPFEVAMPAQGHCEVCAASLGKISSTDELWTGATATIWVHAKGDGQACGDRTVCAACTARANEISTIAAAIEGLGPDSSCDICQTRPEGPVLRRIKYKLFSDDPWVASLERIKQQTEQSEQGSDSKKGPWILR